MRVLEPIEFEYFRLGVPRMRENLAALKLFVRVARTGSFSRAGSDLGLSQQTASRTIAGLERELGVGLFSRTTAP